MPTRKLLAGEEQATARDVFDDFFMFDIQFLNNIRAPLRWLLTGVAGLCHAYEISQSSAKYKISESVMEKITSVNPNRIQLISTSGPT